MKVQTLHWGSASHSEAHNSSELTFHRMSSSGPSYSTPTSEVWQEEVGLPHLPEDKLSWQLLRQDGLSPTQTQSKSQN